MFENDNIQTIWARLSDPKPEEKGRGVKKSLFLRTVTAHVQGATLGLVLELQRGQDQVSDLLRHIYYQARQTLKT